METVGELSGYHHHHQAEEAVDYCHIALLEQWRGGLKAPFRTHSRLLMVI